MHFLQYDARRQRAVGAEHQYMYADGRGSLSQDLLEARSCFIQEKGRTRDVATLDQEELSRHIASVTRQAERHHLTG